MSPTTQKTCPTLSENNLSAAQNAAIDRLYEHDETLLIAGVGFGKAIVGLTALQSLVEAGVITRVLVLAPLRVATLTWGSEPDKWTHIRPGLVSIACGSPAERHAAVASGAPIVVTNFENALWMLSNYGDQFDGLLVDELGKLKTVSGTVAKKLRHWVKKLKWRAGMSATPVAECGHDIYGQALLLDCGKALGTRKQAFLDEYFYPTDYQRRNWVLKPDSAALLGKALKGLIFKADDAGYVDALPPLVSEVCSTLTLPSDTARIYAELDKHSVLPDLNVTAPSAGVKSLKLFQLAAGGLYDDDKNLVHFNTNKIDWACTIITEVCGPVIIVYQFLFELDELRRRFPEAPVLGDGGKFGTAELAQWSAGKIPVLLMHPRSAAHGLNLQYGGNVMIQLSPIFGADPAAQVVGRIHRRGQPADRVFHYVGCAPGTVDERALEKLNTKSIEERKLMKEFS